jgi:hypothetical protein
MASQEILNSNLVSAIVGTVSGLTGVFFGEWLKDRKICKENRRKYKAAVLSARHELSFYAQLLIGFSDEMNSMILQMEKFRATWVKPSFAVYPSFLEVQKNEICALSKNYDLVLKVVECHFNLCHLKEMMDSIEKTVVQANEVRYLIENMKSVGVLAKSSAVLFETTARQLADEANSF